MKECLLCKNPAVENDELCKSCQDEEEQFYREKYEEYCNKRELENGYVHHNGPEGI